MDSEILTPLQAAFLARFFETGVSRRFFLTGGTALAAFHLQHRISKDLDLFTLDDDALDDVDRIIGEIVGDLGTTIDRARRVEHFRQFHLVAAGDEPERFLQVDRDGQAGGPGNNSGILYTDRERDDRSIEPGAERLHAIMFQVRVPGEVNHVR